MQPGASAIAISEKQVSFTDAKGAPQAVAADHVIAAKGAEGNLTLADTLKAHGFAVHAIGDATGVGYIEGAMRGAREAVHSLG